MNNIDEKIETFIKDKNNREKMMYICTAFITFREEEGHD